jgi:mRNA-degrading endonuclease toxin of MazEF toxin-antitoxin module
MEINKYGDIVLVAGGAYSSKPRPVLVFQNKEIPTGDSVIIIPFTTTQNSDIQTRISVSPSAQNGLDRKCFLEADKISAINKTYIGSYVGVLESTYLKNTLAVVMKLITPNSDLKEN